MTQSFFTPQIFHSDRDDWEVRFGHGIWFRVDKMSGKVVYYQKEGVNPGVSGMIRCYPERDINVVILSNMEDGAWVPGRKVHELIVGE